MSKVLRVGKTSRENSVEPIDPKSALMKAADELSSRLGSSSSYITNSNSITNDSGNEKAAYDVASQSTLNYKAINQMMEDYALTINNYKAMVSNSSIDWNNDKEYIPKEFLDDSKMTTTGSLFLNYITNIDYLSKVFTNTRSGKIYDGLESIALINLPVVLNGLSALAKEEIMLQ